MINYDYPLYKSCVVVHLNKNTIIYCYTDEQFHVTPQLEKCQSSVVCVIFSTIATTRCNKRWNNRDRNSNDRYYVTREVHSRSIAFVPWICSAALPVKPWVSTWYWYGHVQVCRNESRRRCGYALVDAALQTKTHMHHSSRTKLCLSMCLVQHSECNESKSKSGGLYTAISSV